MAHLNAYGLGIFVGLVISLLIVCVVIKAMRKRRGSAFGTFDERQRLAQGKAYKLAFFTLLFYLAGYALFDLLTGLVWCDAFTGVFIGILLSVVVFAIVCIRDDAYFSLGENPKRTLWILFAVGAINISTGLSRLISDGTLLHDGLLTYRSINLFTGCALFVILGYTFIRVRRQGRYGETER